MCVSYVLCSLVYCRSSTECWNQPSGSRIHTAPASRVGNTSTSILDNRGELNLKQQYARTNPKTKHILICGFCENDLDELIKQSINIMQFKKNYKTNSLEKYRSEERECISH